MSNILSTIRDYSDAPARNVADFPALKLCFPMNGTAISKTVTDEVLGIEIGAVVDRYTPLGDGGMRVTGLATPPVINGTFPTLDGTNSILWFGVFADCNLNDFFWFGEAYNTGPGIGFTQVNGAYIIESLSAYYGTATAIPALDTLSAVEPTAVGVASEPGASPKCKALCVSPNQARAETTVADNVGTVGSIVPFGNQITLPNNSGNAVHYGIMLFEFSGTTLPDDWRTAVEWMSNDWSPKVDGTPGEKRIYPAWKNKS